MTRLRALVSNPVERAPADEALRFYALENVESAMGRLINGTEIDAKADEAGVMHRPGDVRFGKLRPYLRKSLLMNDHGSGSGELLVLRPLSGLDSRFLHYLTLSKSFVDWATATSYGVKMPRTSWEAVSAYQLDAPPLDEQCAIADYLDAETARIDALIAEQERLRDFLVERVGAERESLLLAHTGSGSPDWMIGRLKRFVRVARGRFTHRPRNDPDLYGGDYPFIQTGDIANATDGVVQAWSQTLNERGFAASRLAPAGTLVMAIAANIGDVARLGFDACFPDSIVALTPRSDVLSGYLLELIRALSKELLGRSTLNTQLNINVERIGDVLVAIPSLEEQQRLVDRIGERAAEVTAATTEIDVLVSLLREHRQALITHAVTRGVDGLPGVA